MITVFLSGSRRINHLNGEILTRLGNIVEKGFRVVVGDANGADKALQEYLADMNYSNVIVFCSGQSCRNNVGNWSVKRIRVDSGHKGREFYMQKDREMAGEADYGFVLWDGKSPGSISNVVELLKRNKKALVYLFPEKRFFVVASLDDARELLKRCDKGAVEVIDKKIKLSNSIMELESINQSSLGF